tara:strand:+ start:111 stop:449 length:339 start_codon:yes stop_codon:yes gene_type:complete
MGLDQIIYFLDTNNVEIDSICYRKNYLLNSIMINAAQDYNHSDDTNFYNVTDINKVCELIDEIDIEKAKKEMSWVADLSDDDWVDCVAECENLLDKLQDRDDYHKVCYSVSW